MTILSFVGLLTLVLAGVWMILAGFSYFAFIKALTGKAPKMSLVVVAAGMTLIVTAVYLAPFRVVVV